MSSADWGRWFSYVPAPPDVSVTNGFLGSGFVSNSNAPLSFDNLWPCFPLERFWRRMIRKVARNVSRASPKATPMTIPATVPFASRLLSGVEECVGEVWAKDDEAEVVEAVVDEDFVAF